MRCPEPTPMQVDNHISEASIDRLHEHLNVPFSGQIPKQPHLEQDYW